ncbi:MAG: hypothetical protein H7A51_13235 [Akkermansiaceae bacterium]|nr:hypothetical protein [Akkermansiaceae bacterium]
MKSINLTITAFAVCLLTVFADEKAPVPTKPAEVRKLLSSHVTLATFDGIRFQKCRHLTALCPDKCTHGGKVATFTVTKYLDYQKPGKYGDPKATTFLTMVQDQLGNAKVPDDTLVIINALKKGDAVRLSWNHDYVTKNGASYPVRTITKLVRMDAADPKGE